MSVIEHHIQRDIIDRLTRAAELRFSELKPAGMESNIFMYHLKQLMSQGYVQKSGSSYSLAAKGLTYVDGLSTENLKPRPQPKVICILALHDGNGQWLLAERKIQPYIGMRMFISGKQHRGESSSEHSVRELYEKTGLRDVPLERRGMADVRINDEDGELLTHAVARVYVGQVAPTVRPIESDRFRFVWHDFAKDHQPLMPGTHEVYTQLRSSDSFDISIQTTL